MGHNNSSAEHGRHPYLRNGFYLNPDNQFWNVKGYSEEYIARMNKLVESFYRRPQLNLINTK